jgi:hypothetical protein
MDALKEQNFWEIKDEVRGRGGGRGETIKYRIFIKKSVDAKNSAPGGLVA